MTAGDDGRKGAWYKTWYDNKIIVVLASIFLFPLGMYGLWKSNSFTTWRELSVKGQFWRVVWVFWAMSIFVSPFISEEQAELNAVEKSNVGTPSIVKKPDVIPSASLMTLTEMKGLYWVNHLHIKSNGYSLTVRINRPYMKKRHMVLSTKNDNFDMIGAEYYDGKDSYYINDSASNIRFTLTDVDYSQKRAEFEFVAMLQTNLRDKGKSIDVQFIVEGDDFDRAIKAGIIAAEVN